MHNYTAIKEQYPLRNEIENHLGPPIRAGSDPFWNCPFHNDQKTPNFHLMPDGEKFRCFSAQCGATGDVIDFIAKRYNVDQQEAINILTSQVPAPTPTKPPLATKKTGLTKEQAWTKVAKMTDKVDWYHAQLTDFAFDYFHNQGLNDQTIEEHKLGYAPKIPIHYPGEGTDSLVIPTFWNERLVSIRHRLTEPNGHGKYRPEFKGLKLAPFNLDSLKREEINFSLLKQNEVLIIEGEIKAMVVRQYLGGAVVGLPGATSWQEKWGLLPDFQGYRKAYVMMDADVQQAQLEKIAAGLKQMIPLVVLCKIQVKPDDFFVKYNFSVERFMNHLKRGRIYG